MDGMSKTPEEIKKGLRMCAGTSFCDKDCPYYYDCNDGKPSSVADALALIQHLETQNAELVKRVEQLKADKKKIMETAEILSNAVTRLERERDALLEDLADHCGSKTLCKKYEDGTCPHGYDCTLYLSTCEDYEWRGVPEQETNEPIRAD